jgi:D-glycerate 3-kinase
MATFVDDKTPICVPFILDHLKSHHTSSSKPPFVIGLNGIQGAGKTTLVSALASALEVEGVPTLVCSIDDFYLNHEDLVALGRDNADNALLHHRGEPGASRPRTGNIIYTEGKGVLTLVDILGTHDLPLARTFFDKVMKGEPTRLPVYDKSAYSGHGDRAPEERWKPVNQPDQPTIKAVILEGWLVGFRALSDADVKARWKAPSRTLGKHKLEHLLFINEQLKGYDALTDLFDAFIHIDAEDTQFVYTWRAQQEEHLRSDKGDPNAGMSPDEVVRFVDGYFPAYELYTDGVRAGVLSGQPGKQLRLVVDKNRKVKQVHRL